MPSTLLKPGAEIVAQAAEGPYKLCANWKEPGKSCSCSQDYFWFIAYYWEASKMLARFLHLVTHIDPALEMQQHSSAGTKGTSRSEQKVPS